AAEPQAVRPTGARHFSVTSRAKRFGVAVLAICLALGIAMSLLTKAPPWHRDLKGYICTACLSTNEITRYRVGWPGLALTAWRTTRGTETLVFTDLLGPSHQHRWKLETSAVGGEWYTVPGLEAENNAAFLYNHHQPFRDAVHQQVARGIRSRV